MKILHIVPTYLPATRYGGPTQSVHSLNKWLVKLGVEVTVYTTTVDGPDNLDVPTDRAVDMDGVKVFYFPPGRMRSWFYSGAMRLAIKKHVREFDLIHITSVFLAPGFLGAWYARRARKPYIISPRGSLMNAPLHRKSSLKKRLYIALIEKSNLRRAAAVHFTVNAEEKEYRDAGLPLRRSIVIPNGLDPESLPPGDGAEFRKKFGIGPDKKMILFLSRINWKKGLDILVEGYAALLGDMPEAVLVIAGGDDEGYRKEIDKKAEEEGISGKIIFTGELRGAEKTSAYLAADIFILPSYSENFGMAVAEAMHLGIPVIVTREVGIAPWVDEGGAGFVINPEAWEVRMALFKALQDPAHLRKMGENGKRVVEKSFSPQAVAEAFQAAYNGLIHEKSAGYRNSPHLQRRNPPRHLP